MKKGAVRLICLLSAFILTLQLFVPAAFAQEAPAAEPESPAGLETGWEDTENAATGEEAAIAEEADPPAVQEASSSDAAPAAQARVQEIELTAKAADPARSAFRLTLSGVPEDADTSIWFEVSNVSGLVPAVRFPAWRQESDYIAFTNTHLQPASGFYTVTACSGSTDDPEVLAETYYFIPGLTSGSVKVAADGQTGMFTCIATASAGAAEVISMRAAIWRAADQSDLQWTQLHREAGFWVSDPLDVQSFGGFGSFTVHAYATLENGIDALAAGSQQEMVPKNYLTAGRTGTRHYGVSILGPSATDNLRAAVWSAADGQNDLIWYPASQSEDDSWSVDVISTNHKNSGTYMAHFYAGNELLGGTSFEVDPADMLTPAEARIVSGCEKVVSRVGTDLHANYLWVVRNFSYTRRSGHLKPPSGYTREQWYAVEGLETQNGNCYTFAATFCELAKYLGYDARYVEGAVYGVGQKWWPHGFVFITIDGSTYICDPELQFASSAGRNLYMQPISSPRATYRW